MGVMAYNYKVEIKTDENVVLSRKYFEDLKIAKSYFDKEVAISINDIKNKKFIDNFKKIQLVDITTNNIINEYDSSTDLL